MNIQMQICGMIILIVLAVFYKSNRTLKLYSEGILCSSSGTESLGENDGIW